MITADDPGWRQAGRQANAGERAFRATPPGHAVAAMIAATATR